VETAKIVPERPKRKQRSEKTRMGRGTRDEGGAELSFWASGVWRSRRWEEKVRGGDYVRRVAFS
jgi:hypothetical protein